MKLIVGLGNPGPQHSGQRHNIGFMALDAIADRHGSGPWKQRFHGVAADGRLGASRVTLLKPSTFMNLSGQAVGDAMRYLKLQPSDVIVLHDELDLAPGQLRWKIAGGHAGHNGLRSIHQHIGDSYTRVRIGIGHPGDKARVSGYVLSNFSMDDDSWLQTLIPAIAEAAPFLAAGDGPRFQTAVALQMKPDRNSASDRTAGRSTDRSAVRNAGHAGPRSETDLQPAVIDHHIEPEAAPQSQGEARMRPEPRQRPAPSVSAAQSQADVEDQTGKHAARGETTAPATTTPGPGHYLKMLRDKFR